MSNEAFTALLGRYRQAEKEVEASVDDTEKWALFAELSAALGEIPRAKGHDKTCLCQTCDNIRSRPPTTEKRENYCIKVPWSLREKLRELGPAAVEAVLAEHVATNEKGPTP